MTAGNTSHNSDPSDNPRPSEEEQNQRLQPILAENMRTMITDRVFFQKLLAAYAKRFPEAASNGNNNDKSLVVHRGRYGKRLEDGSWQEGESILVGFKNPFGDGAYATSFVSIAKRIDTPDGTRLEIEEGYSREEAEMVVDMVDNLMLAKHSGQIPDLDEMSLDRIYIPAPASSMGDYQ